MSFRVSSKIYSIIFFLNVLFLFQENGFCLEKPVDICISSSNKPLIRETKEKFSIANNNDQYISIENPEIRFDENTIFNGSDSITFDGRTNSFKLIRGGYYSMIGVLKSSTPISLAFLVNDRDLIFKNENCLQFEDAVMINTLVYVNPNSTLKLVLNNQSLTVNSVAIHLSSVDELRERIGNMKFSQN